MRKSRVLFLTAAVCTFTVGLKAQLIVPEGLKPVPTDHLPKQGTFWYAKGPHGRLLPPSPLPPGDPDLQVYNLGDGQFLIDNTAMDYDAVEQQEGVIALGSLTALTSTSGPPMPGGGGGGGNTTNAPDARRNYAKFMNQAFAHIDMNAAAVFDTNLYNFCNSSFPTSPTGPNLQIKKYGTNMVVIKANHFNYSSETRDFALVVSGNVSASLWKSVDLLGASDAQEGWVVQGTVPRWLVADPIFLLVSNIVTDCPAFYRAVPYAGPVVQLSGYPQNATVSGTITLNAAVTDLSGVTNDQFQVTVDGLPARYALLSGNNISVETKYNYNGCVTVYLNASSRPVSYNSASPPIDAKLAFSTSGTLPLDFENANCLVFQSDYCSPAVGTNYIVFSVSKAQRVDVTITDPSNSQTLAYYSQSVSPGQVTVPWSFTKSDGHTPYTNDSYKVTIVCYDPDTFSFTNKIDRTGVRPGAGCYLTYEYENPAGIEEGYMNYMADTWILGTLKSLYLNLYAPRGLTQYNDPIVGTNRNHADCMALTISSGPWSSFLAPALAKSIYSDFTVAQAHGSGAEIGGGPYLSSRFTTYDLQSWLLGCGKDWRLRKAALWTCYSGSMLEPVPGGLNLSFPEACGMRAAALEANSYMMKNCGLFFAGKLPQYGFSGNAVTAQVAEFFDQTWVCGKYQFPGGCDPTYSFYWTYLATKGQYPEITYGDPQIAGYGLMIFSSYYDNELLTLNTTHVKTR